MAQEQSSDIRLDDKETDFNNLAMQSLQTYRHSEDPADLDSAIDFLEFAIYSVPKSDCIPVVVNLANCLTHRFKLQSNISDINTAIELGRYAVSERTDDESVLARRIQMLCASLRARVHYTGHTDDLDEIMNLAERALTIDRSASNLDSLAGSLFYRYELTGDADDLDRAITTSQEALTLTLDRDTRARRMQNLSNCLSERYNHSRTPSDLEEAVRLARSTISETSDESSCHMNLAMRLGQVFAITGEPSEIDEAVKHADLALLHAKKASQEHTKYLNNLSTLLKDRYVLTGDENDLDRSIQVLREALQACSKDHKLRCLIMTNLASRLADLYTLTGQKDIVDEVIKLAQDAVRLTPKGDSDRSATLNNLGMHLASRYGIRNEMHDIDAAIIAGSEALALLSAQHTSRPTFTNNQINHLSIRWNVLRNRQDLEDAITLAQGVLVLLPEQHSFRPQLLDNLGARLVERFKLMQDREDLNNAIIFLKESVLLTSITHTSRPYRLLNLGDGLLTQHFYYSTGVDAAIAALQECINLTPTSHLTWAYRARSLALPLMTRYVEHGNKIDKERSLELLEAVASQTSRIEQAIHANMDLLDIYASNREWYPALKAGRLAIDLVSKFVPRFMSDVDKQALLSRFSGLASDCAAVAIQLGKIFLAVELLEQGRGILASNVFDIRTQPPELAQHPSLAQEFADLRTKLAQPDNEHNRGAREKASKAFDRLLIQIRQQPGLESFMLPLSIDDIKQVACRGEIIYVNVSRFRCDALVIGQDSIEHIRLKDLHLDDVQQYSKTLGSSTSTSSMLEWLWRTVSRPILDTVRAKQVWWIPTGLLSQFPLHAAGDHSGNDTVLDRVVSSYASSIKALSKSRQRIHKTDLHLAIVAMQDTPGMHALPYALAEVEAIKQVCSKLSVISEPAPYKDSVVKAIQSSQIFHFAGHGRSNLVNPLQSQLLLSDWQDSPLTLGDLLQTILEHQPLLAYLSACRTSQTDQSNIDEGLHLVNSFQLAGFRHVIGTLWEVDDKISEDIASIFYTEAMQSDFSDDSIGLGLHKAIKHCRDQWRLSLQMDSLAIHRDYGEASQDLERGMDWLPYVHFGG